ncbi:MAG: Gfo/Idh/MocA family oxidoreductase, partial [Pseudomonadota bacterium]|nr:Gfo/Idh/MocA family oxidoreductase [Pseudomonadota bacterium]
MASDTPYKVAVVGLGIVGTRTIELMRRHSRFSVECAFDLSEETRSIAAQTFAGVDILPTLGEVFRRDGINLVYIATPPAAHADIARMAISRNWGVFCEKPLG